jgi:hypothetical protein
MRPTDVCHPYELRVPAPRAFSVRSRHFRGGDTPRSLGLRDVGLRDRMFHDIRDRFGGSSIQHKSRALLPHGLETRTWALSSHGADPIEPLTPLSRPLLSSRLIHLRGCCHLAVGRDFWSCPTGRRIQGPPRPPLTPSREKRRLVMIRDAFCQEVPFLGSGGRYSPGPTTTAPLLAMG